MKLKLFSTLMLAGGLAFGAVIATPASAEPTDKPAAAQPSDKGADQGKSGEKGEKGEKGRRGDRKADKENKDKEKGKASGVMPGDTAPAFELTDTDGKTHKLSDYAGKVVVLEWFNAECPYIVKHHQVNKTFNQLHESYASKDVVFLAINSSAKDKQGYGKQFNADKKKEFGMAYPVLLDESGTVGKAYGAKTTPHVYVIGKDGKLVYQGAIDNNTDQKKAGDVNYGKNAIEAALAGKAMEPATTRPYGCGVKYAN